MPVRPTLGPFGLPLRPLLGLAVAIGTAFGAGTSAGAQTQQAGDLRVSARVEGYVDSDATQVVRPRFALDAAVSERTRLATTYTADVVSSASIDVVTRATQGIRDDRHEVTGTVTQNVGEGRRIALGYAFGTEVDFRSHSGNATFNTRLDERDLTMMIVRVGVGHAVVGTVADPDFRRSLITASASAAISRIVNENLLVRIAVEVSNLHGFQGSAYRTVRLGDWSAMRSDGSDPAAGAWVFSGVTATARENVPDQRFRARVAFDLVQSLGRGFAVALTAATYADTFRIRSAELAPEIRYEPMPGLLFRVGGRAYAQTGALFWRRRYVDAAQTDGYVTDDKELGPMRSYEVHVAAQIPIGAVRIETRLEGDFFRYPEFTLLPEKRALVASVGVVYVR